MSDKKSGFVLPAGKGVGVRFQGIVEAILGASPLDMMAVTYLASGGHLTIAASKGSQLLEDRGVTADRLCPNLRAEFDADGWYGTVGSLPLAVGPFDEEQQAKDAVVLALLGMDVEPVRGPKPKPDAPTKADQLAKQLVNSGVPEQLAKTLADDLVARWGDDVEILATDVRFPSPGSFEFVGEGFVGRTVAE